jgi:ABC-type oligopeptide transport system, periplasmic component
MQLSTPFRAIALATVGLFVVAACGGTGGGTALASAQELRVNIGTEPGTLDPGLTQWVYEAAVDRNVFEAPLKASKDFKSVVGNAADSFDIDSTGTVYTFHLHPGAKWSDGVPVKAADFVYGWQRILDPRLAALYSSFFFNVKNAATVYSMKLTDPGLDAAIQTLGLKAVDDNTFQVTLEAPAGYFKWVASLWVAAPVRKDIVQKYGKDSNGNDKWGAVAAGAPQSVIGNGQFKISEVVPKDHITLVQNPNYAGSMPKPTLTKITLYEIDDETVAYARYKSGELDMANVPLANTEAVRSSSELVQVPELTVFWLDINTKAPPFDNVKVRQAFSQAIDRDSYVTNVLKGRGISASTLIPKGMRNYQPELGTPQKFDATAAKATLAASGVSASTLNGVKYLYNSNSPTNKTIAEFVQAQLKTNLGVNIVLDGTDSKTVSSRLGSGQYQFGGPSGWGADYPDSQDWFDIFMTGSGNQFSNWSNSTYDAAVKAGDEAAADTTRDTQYATAATTLVSEAPVVFLDQRINWWLVKPYVKGLNVTPNDDFLGDLSTYSIQIGQH